MELLVKFIAVDNGEAAINHTKYVNGIFKKLQQWGLINKLMVTPDEFELKTNPVKELDDEGNIFLLEFSSLENDKSNNWNIVFRYGTYHAAKQLETEIYSDTYVIDKDNNYLEKLKLAVKKAIVKDWEKIIWLIDRDSECLSVELYPRIYKTENLMRELINEVMTKQYGISWWDSFVSANIKEKHSKRLAEYKSKVPAFNNVDERLMSIDIDDLSDLITLKRYKWSPVFDEKISCQLNGVQKYDDSIIRELLLRQRSVEADLWKEQFSRYLPDDFPERFHLFAKDRNHIMHNKLIDRTAYLQINNLAETIEKDLVLAINRLNETILSIEEQEEIEKQRQIEEAMQKMQEHERKESEAHVSIRSYDEIDDLFTDSIIEFLNDLDENYRFRSDVEFSDLYQIEWGDTGNLFSIRSKIDDTELSFTYELFIDEAEGADSSFKIYCDNIPEQYVTGLEYKNASAELDPDTGLYVPVIQDQLGDITAVVDAVVEFIDDRIVNYKENAASEDIAEYVFCYECGEDSVCINEDLLPAGTCLNCGYVNQLESCDRCGEWFNSETDGMYEDGVALCQNCLDVMEAE